MRVLVAGATGFLGRRLVSSLTEAGDEVWAVVRRPDHGLPCAVRIADDALDPEPYARVMAENGIEAVVNALAAGVHPADRDPARLVAANATFPADLVRAAAGAGAEALVHVGTSAEYAAVPVDAPLVETAPVETERLYGATKAAGSLLVPSVARAAGLPAAVMRAFNLFGPGEAPHRLLSSLVGQLAAGQPVELSEGTQVRDFVACSDACRAIRRMLAALAKGGAAPGIYNLARGKPVAVRDFAIAVADALGADRALLRFGALPLRPDDLPFVVGNPARLKAAIGPVTTQSLADALDEVVRALQAQAAA